MKNVADWRIFEFLKEGSGQFSSTRLFALAIITSAIIEWQYAIWHGPGIWHPDYATIGLIAGVLGAKILQKGVEVKNKVTQSPSEQQSEETQKIEEISTLVSTEKEEIKNS
jgi:hypothetical protein